MHYALGSDAELLQALSTGSVPQAWTPLATTTTEEVVFLAPLDPVSARGRARVLFDFDYVWEVYKPEHQRRFGYYTLPILWGDRLVARFDSKLDRAQRAPADTFVILGFWLEDEAPWQRCGVCSGIGGRLCSLRYLSRRPQVGCNGDS